MRPGQILIGAGLLVMGLTKLFYLGYLSGRASYREQHPAAESPAMVIALDERGDILTVDSVSSDAKEWKAPPGTRRVLYLTRGPSGWDRYRWWPLPMQAGGGS